MVEGKERVAWERSAWAALASAPEQLIAADRPIASLSWLSPAIALEAARGRRLNSGVGRFLFVSRIAWGYILAMDAEFEWDTEKAESNLEKHDVSFEEAATVFFDPLSLTISDPLHSHEESRFVTTGLSNQERQLVVVHSEGDDRIRIISARLAISSERKKYESGIE